MRISHLPPSSASLLLLTALGSAPSGCAVRPDGTDDVTEDVGDSLWLHVGERNGHYTLVDVHGTRFVPNGVNLIAFSGAMMKNRAVAETWDDPRDGSPDDPGRVDVDLVRSNVADQLSRAKVNFVRGVVSWGDLEPSPPIRRSDGTLQHAWNEAAFRNIVANVQALGARGIRVMIDLHKTLDVFPDRQNTPDWLYTAEVVADRAGHDQLALDLFYGDAFMPGIDLHLGQQPDSPEYAHPGQAGPGSWGPLALWVEVLRELASRTRDLDAMVAIDIQNEPQARSPDQIANYRRFVRMAMARLWAINPHLVVSYETNILSRQMDRDQPKIYTAVSDMPTELPPVAHEGGKLFQFHCYFNGTGGYQYTLTRARADEEAGVVKALHALADNDAARSAFLIGEWDGFAAIRSNRESQPQTPAAGTPFVSGAGNPTADELIGGPVHGLWDSRAPADGGLLDWMWTNEVGHTFWAGIEGAGGTIFHPAAEERGSSATLHGDQYPRSRLKTAANNDEPIGEWLAWFAH